MGKLAKGVNEINFTMLYGNYCYIIIENFPQKFFPCRLKKFEKMAQGRIPSFISLCVPSGKYLEKNVSRKTKLSL